MLITLLKGCSRYVSSCFAPFDLHGIRWQRQGARIKNPWVGWPQDRGCSATPVATTNHINVEGWTESYARTWAQIERDYPQNAPRNLGNMGFLVEMMARCLQRSCFSQCFERIPAAECDACWKWRKSKDSLTLSESSAFWRSNKYTNKLKDLAFKDLAKPYPTPPKPCRSEHLASRKSPESRKRESRLTAEATLGRLPCSCPRVSNWLPTTKKASWPANHMVDCVCV